MRKLIINISVLLFIALPITLIGVYTFAYEVLIIKTEVETVETIKPIETKYSKESLNLINEDFGENNPKLMCDGCAQYKENLKQVKLQDIHQPVLLCEECQLKFKEVNND